MDSIQQLLDHMNESAVYNESDLAPFQKRLDELRDIVQSDIASGKHPIAMTKLLERQLKDCCTSDFPPYSSHCPAGILRIYA